MFEAENIGTVLLLVPALPLLATLVTLALGKFWLRGQSHLPAVAALAGSFALSLWLLMVVNQSVHQAEEETGSATGEAHAAAAATDPVGFEVTRKLWTWALIPAAYTERPWSAGSDTQVPGLSRTHDFTVNVTLRADPLSAVMLVVITFIGLLVAIYSVGYMHGDPGYWRYFTYVSLFVFSMTMLVTVSNFVLLYVFWEAVGLCSYLLIGFWFHKPAAAAAGKKAFLVNRVGDFGFALGVFLIWTLYGTLDFHDELTATGQLSVAGVLGQTRLANPEQYYVGGAFGVAVCLCLLLGACGKSAQFPLHIWLPDAMEGPTPVSALIHAATMVTAGVYLVARCTPLFFAVPEGQVAVAVIGGFTALLAALIAVTQTDLKRVLAYSTVSQLGFMFLGLGTGSLAGVVAGMFHLFTHAFFKALLFLGAGSVMHAMGGVIDMQRFSGLRKILPWTCATFWFGAMALAGVVPFAGFWSKEGILGAVFDRAGADDTYAQLYNVLYYGALATAFLTSFYTFRALFLTFYGRTEVPHEAGHHAHESPPVMTAPLVILAACSLLVGALGSWFGHFLLATPSLAYVGAEAEHGHGDHMQIAVWSTILAVGGLALAAYFYLGERAQIERIARWARSPYGLRAYHLSRNKFFFDQIYGVLIIAPLRLMAAVAAWFDCRVIDRLVDFCGRIPFAAGSTLRALQNGMVQFYALAMVLGLLVLAASLLIGASAREAEEPQKEGTAAVAPLPSGVVGDIQPATEARRR